MHLFIEGIFGCLTVKPGASSSGFLIFNIEHIT